MRTVLDRVDLQAQTQHAAYGRDLRNVSICAPKEGGFPVMLTDWTDFRIYDALPARASLGILGEEILNAAWELGAWDVDRLEVGPLAATEESRKTEEAIRVLIGRGPYLAGAGEQEPVELDAEGVIIQLTGLGCEHGLVHWATKPNAYNPSRRCASTDGTLLADGTRSPRGSAGWHNLQPLSGTNHATLYQLGEE